MKTWNDYELASRVDHALDIVVTEIEEEIGKKRDFNNVANSHRLSIGQELVVQAIKSSFLYMKDLKDKYPA